MKPAEIADQLRALGLRHGGVLLVHTSFRAVRPVEGGPSGLIDALRLALGPGGTLVMPTMTDGESIFDPRTTPTVDMGITAETFWRRAGVVRSTHPGGSFAAEGPLAKRICAPQPLSPPHGIESPPGRVYELDGQILLLGVHYSECTVVHVAESLAKVPYAIAYPCVIELDGRAERVMIPETDSCCEGFRRVEDWLRERSLQRRGPVGHAEARLANARDVVRVAVEHLERDPLAFLCPASNGCEDCNTARASIAAS